MTMSRTDVLVTADWVEEHLDDPKVVVLIFGSGKLVCTGRCSVLLQKRPAFPQEN